MSKGKAGRWLKSANGILTSVAGIMTSAAAILGVLFVHQNSQINQYISIVQRQTQQIHSLQARPLVAKNSPAPDPSVSGGANSGGQIYLSNVSPNVDVGEVSDGATTIDGQSYPNSVSFGCDGQGSSGQPTEAWDVAGQTTFTATVGVPDKTEDATGHIGQLTFASQDGTKLTKVVSVSLGHPATVSFSVSGVTQLDVTCNAIVASTGQQAYDLEVSLGNASAS